MLTAVKNQFKISFLSVKYALMREMLNKTTFISNIVFMILNNASFIIQWVVLFSLKDSIGGYSFKEVLLLWGIASGTYGVSRFFFKNAFSLSHLIIDGKLDSYLVQPKNVLLSAITTSVDASAIGDIIYAYIILFIYGFTIPKFILLNLFMISGGLILTAISVILSSFSFWFGSSEAITDTGNSLMTNIATYPEGIFKGIVKALLFTLIPIGLVNYIPVKLLVSFDLNVFILVIISTIVIIATAFIIFYRGLKRYSSSNLMIAKI